MRKGGGRIKTGYLNLKTRYLVRIWFILKYFLWVLFSSQTAIWIKYNYIAIYLHLLIEYWDYMVTIENSIKKTIPWGQGRPHISPTWLTGVNCRLKIISDYNRITPLKVEGGRKLLEPVCFLLLYSQQCIHIVVVCACCIF